ncbi:MAG: hypothetical protein QXP98_07530 [Thermoproteus sp.]
MWFETTYRCPRCGGPLAFREGRGRIGLWCRRCRTGVWTDGGTVSKFLEGGAFRWRELLGVLAAAYEYRLAFRGA